MPADSVPGNMTGSGVAPNTGYVAAATGAELAQSRLARANTGSTATVGMVGDSRMQGRATRIANVDLASPQRFKAYPAIVDAVETASVGIDTGGQRLPGRVRPLEWDGEPGWRSPMSGEL